MSLLCNVQNFQFNEYLAVYVICIPLIVFSSILSNEIFAKHIIGLEFLQIEFIAIYVYLLLGGDMTELSENSLKQRWIYRRNRI